MRSNRENQYDLFVSYAHRDNGNGWISSFLEALEQEHAEYTPTPLSLFFDTQEIRTMDDWEHRILNGLRHSRLMIAFVSPLYFDSAYCRKEWEWYADHEKDRFLHGEAIAPIYFIEVPGFETDAEERLEQWRRDLRRRQYLDARPWHSGGVEALRQEDVRQRMKGLHQDLLQKWEKSEARDRSHSTIPPSNPQFVGRLEDLRWIKEQLGYQRVGVVTAVHGLGGIGKTALAYEYANAYHDLYPGGRFLVSCAGVSDLRLPFISLAEQFGIELTDEERRSTELAYARIRSAIENGERKLLLLDNIDDSALFSPAQMALLPGRDRVHILMTTRLEPTASPLLACRPLDTLSEAEAVRLLEKYRPFGNDNERAAAHEIARLLDGYALALEVVAVYLWKHEEITCADYLLRLKEEHLAALEGAGRDEQVDLQVHKEKLLTRLLEPTLALLSEPERLALEFASLLPPDFVALPWLKHLVGEQFPEITETKPGYPDPWMEIERRLTSLRLLTAKDDKLARMHRLIGEVVQTRIPAESHTQRTIMDYALQRWHHLEDLYFRIENQWELKPLSVLVWQEMEKESTEGTQLGKKISLIEREIGNLEEARRLLKRVIEIEGKLLQPDHPNIAKTYFDLAIIEQTLGNLDESQCLMMLAITILENAYDTNHPELAAGYSNMATIYWDLGNLELARNLLKRAIEIWEKTSDSDEPILAIRLCNLALIERDLGNIEQSRFLFKRAIEIWGKSYEPDHPELAVGYTNLGMVERDLGNLEEAGRLHKQAIVIWEKAFGIEHSYIAAGYSNLALVERDLGNLELARDLQKRSHAIWEKLFKPDHPSIAISYSNLATIERDAGNLDEAYRLINHTIEIQEAAFESDHPSLAISYSTLATIEREYGNLVEARRLLKRAIVIQEKVFESDHHYLAKTYYNLATVEHASGETTDARYLFERAYSIFQAKLGSNHPSTLGVAAWLQKIVE